MIGLDTSAIIDVFKGKEAIKNILDDIDEELAVSFMSYLELMFGFNTETIKEKKEEEFYDAFFNSFTNFELTKEACKKASKIFWDLKKRGEEIDEFDCIIAGIFLTKGVNTIITRNVKHFEKIRELKVIGY